MTKFIKILLCIILISIGGTVMAQPPAMPPLRIEEVDGNPSGVVTLLQVSNGALTQVGSTFQLTVGAGVAEVEDDPFGVGWNGDTTHAPSQNVVFDYYILFDTDLDGLFSDEAWWIGVDEVMGVGWNGDPGIPEKDDIYDYLVQLDSNMNGTLVDEAAMLLVFEQANSNNIDPDRLAGDVTDDNLIDSAIGGLGVNAGAFTGVLGMNAGTGVSITTPALLETYANLGAYASNILAAISEANFKNITNLEIGVDVQAYDADLTTYAGITPSANVQSLLGAANYAAMRTQLGLVIGTNVQAYDADLTTYAGITPSANVQSLLGAADYSAMRTLLTLTENDIEALIFDADAEQISGSWEVQDNVHFSFGNDDDYSWLFNSTSSNAELVDSGNNVLFWIESDGSANSAAVASPAWAQYDSDAVGADRADEYTGGIEIPMTTTTEDLEDADMELYIQQGGGKTLIMAFDESDDQWESSKAFTINAAVQGTTLTDGTASITGGAGSGFTTFTMSSYLANGADPADAGAIRLDNGAAIAWEDGTEVTLTHVDDTGLALNVSSFTVAAADNPYAYFNESDGTDWWIGVDDTGNTLEIRNNATVGNNVMAELSEAGSLTLGDGGDHDIVFTADNDDTDGTITRYADEKTWEFSNIIGIAPQTYDASDQDDTDFTIGTTGTSTIILMTGDNDGDNDSIDLQNPTRAGQIVRFYASANIDADDTITVDTTTDSTCTGCTTVVLDEVGDSFECMALTTSLWNCWQLNEVP